MFCPKCGSKNPDGSKFCANCGEFCGELEVVFPDEMLAVAPVKRKKGKGALVAFFALFAVVIGVVAFFLLRGNEDAQSILWYVKDDELYMVYNEDYSARKLTKSLFSNEKVSNYRVYSFVKYFQDKNVLVYPDKMSSIDYNYDECSLYYTDTRLSKADEEVREKIDDHVRAIYPSHTGDYMYYVTNNGDSQTLYYYDFDDSEEIISAKHINYVNISEDGKVACLIATKSDDKKQAYIISDRTDTKKLLADADFMGSNKDLSTMVFSKDGRVFVCKDYTTVNEVDEMSYDKSFSVQYIDENGNIYYTLPSDKKYKVRDYIYDDSYNMDIDDFYWADNTFTMWNDNVLYVYNGTSSKNLGINMGYSATYTDDWYFFDAYNVEKAGKLNLSEMYDDGDVTSTVRSHLQSYGEYYMIKDGKITKLFSGENVSLVSSINEDYVYYISRDNKDDLSGDLHRVKLNGTGDKVIDSDVYEAYVTEEGEVYAFKDPVKDRDNEDVVICDLFYQDKKIASDVTTSRNAGLVDDCLYYISDYDGEEGTLYKADGKKVTELVDGISYISPYYAEDIIYGEENDDGTADVFVWSDGEEIKIDSDIQIIYPAYAVDYKEE